MKVITALTGLTPETLRAWERRYQVIAPSRTESGRRSYSEQELEKLLLMADLTRNGHAIGKIASLHCDALRALQRQTRQRHSNENTPLLAQIIEALQNYRIDQCEQLLKRALVAHEPLAFMRDVLLPLLTRIGDLWHESKLNVAQEHMFSNCAKRIILSMANNMHIANPSSRSMLFATPSDESHEFGILICCLLAAAQHYQCYYLGTNLPGQDIADAIAHLKPNVVVIGLTLAPPLPTTQEQLRIVFEAAAERNIPLWLGGSGSKMMTTELLNCRFVGDIEQFYRIAQ